MRTAAQRAAGRKHNVKRRSEEAYQHWLRVYMVGRKQTHRAKNWCDRCKNQRVEGRTECIDCILKSAARTHLGSRTRWPELFALVREFEFRCAYTGRFLHPGHNLSFDHKIPRAKGGVSDIGNLVPCDKFVNRAKSDLPFAEFYALCREVVAYGEQS